LRASAALALLALAAGCARSLPAAYERERAAAERAYAHGRYDEAAEHWLGARKAAEHNRERQEAVYRAAQSLRRARRYDESSKLLAALIREFPRSERAERAAYDLAALAIERGDAERGHAELERAVRRHPGSGLARGALTRLIARVEERGGTRQALAWIEQRRAAFSATELAEHVEYARAELLERAGELEQALAGYLAVAERFGYPRGDVWDDALYEASVLEEKLGRPARAIAHLERMLAEREPSHLQGSYERPRYAQARFRIAELRRDRLNDAPAARREFRRVFAEHPTSPLRDDALWNEAVLARKSGDRAGACAALELLVEELKDSRFVPCAHELCPSVEPDASRSCRDYIRRALREESGER
jgi:TolA-binding protein